ncbi:hypothetical protein [Paraburkholderia sp.]|jgi:hypothetical protein|nr:hypothetical protein [Paraburkholderia sp.]MEA3129183.1 hypothetical protein [Paraburkholderia sp.]
MSGKYRDLVVFELGNDGRAIIEQMAGKGAEGEGLGQEVLAV